MVDSREYAKKNGQLHMVIIRSIRNIIKYLNIGGINYNEYYEEHTYVKGNKPGVYYMITDKGLKLLKSKKRAKKIIEYAIVEIENNGIYLPEWVYNNLKTYGNCSINEKYVKDYGEIGILHILKEKGINCTLDVHDVKLEKSALNNTKAETMTFCILQVEK